MNKQLFEKMSTLTKIQGVSGHEMPIAKFLHKQMKNCADTVKMDALGNVLATKKGKRQGPVCMIAAHMDQIGAVVKSIDSNGFIGLEKVGGILDALLLGRKVKIGEIHGVIGVKPGHYQDAEDRKKVVPADQLYIDVGANNKQDVMDMNIAIGDPIVYDDTLTLLHDQQRFVGAAVDNRAGCAVLWKLMQEIQDVDFGGELTAAFTVQEEVGLRGAQTAAYSVNPDFAIALDTIPCGGTPDVDPKDLPTSIGKGPVFAFTSGAGGSFTCSPIVKKMLLEHAEKTKIPYQTTVFCKGNNDAASISTARSGFATGSITLPRRYAHTPVETGDLRDMVHTVTLIKSIVRQMESVDSFVWSESM